jgi:hypothetical protein
MMRSRSTVLVVAVGAASLLAVAYFGLRPGPPHSSPDVVSETRPSGLANQPASAEGAPASTASTSALTAALSGSSGDSARGSFRTSQQCYFASRELALSKRNAGDCKMFEGRPEYQNAYAECLNKWVDARNRAAAAEATMAKCGGSGDRLRAYYEATKQAAANGDADAQLCYLRSDFNYLDDQSPFYTEADEREYDKVAPRYVTEALQRGDWRIVHLLATRSFNPSSGLVPRLDKIGQPQTIYKMTKLLRLGASGSYANFLDSILAEQGLTQDEASKGDAWAQETYTQYYSGVPGLTEAPVVCDQGLEKK